MRSDGERLRKRPSFLVQFFLVQLAVVDIGTEEGLLCLVSSLLSLICVGRLFGSCLWSSNRHQGTKRVGYKGGLCCAIKGERRGNNCHGALGILVLIDRSSARCAHSHEIFSFCMLTNHAVGGSQRIGTSERSPQNFDFFRCHLSLARHRHTLLN